MILSDSSQQKKEQNKLDWRMLFRMYKVFGRHYKNHWKLLAVAYAGLFLTILLALLSPWPLKLILDYVILKNPLPEQAAFLTRWIGGNAYSLLSALVLAYILLQVLDSVVSYVHKIGMMTVGAKMTAEIQERIFAHVQRLSLSFHASARTGDLIYRLTSDVGSVNTFLISVPQDFVYRLAIIFSHVGVMWALEPRLALIAFGVIPILFYFQRRIGHKLKSVSRQKRSKDGDIASLVAENLSAMALVQAYGREGAQQARFQSQNRESLELGISAMRLSKLFKRTNDILIACGACGVVYYGGSLALEGAILPGTLVLFASYLKKLYGPVEKFADMLLGVTQAQIGAERLLELVDCDMVMQDDPKAVPAPPLQGRIEFRNISFAYNKNTEVLKNLSFTAAPGETVALVGHSGAGKSTLISLLLRFHDPAPAGQILIDGHPLRDFTLKSLRGQMTVVMQEAKLFNKTVGENIGFGKIEATEEEIIRAAKLAQAHEFIMQMPQGYDTMISEGGNNLSGGQKQRLNIARAMIRDAAILILDEPATALDARAEAKIHQALDELTKGKTTFIIAHKFSTIARAGKILALEDGRLVGYGSHEELIHACRPYRELYELQFGPRLEHAQAGPIDNNGKLIKDKMIEVKMILEGKTIEKE